MPSSSHLFFSIIVTDVWMGSFQENDKEKPFDLVILGLQEKTLKVTTFSTSDLIW